MLWGYNECGKETRREVQVLMGTGIAGCIMVGRRPVLESKPKPRAPEDARNAVRCGTAKLQARSLSIGLIGCPSRRARTAGSPPHFLPAGDLPGPVRSLCKAEGLLRSERFRIAVLGIDS